ncbi:MAG: hypothetical protein ABS81_01220 [Pseudonocardia sp. SCN 72-86]|nr:MAG: hypothetical protein ABS81_01220 [Pseudonocardia sp. SCN 72-86]
MEVKGVAGTVTFDGATVAISRRGFAARASIGKGEKRIPVRHITAVQFKPAGLLVNGFIQFTLGGSVERRSQFGRQSFDAAGDENSVLFSRQQQPAFEQLRDAIEHAMTYGVAHQPPPPGPPPRPSGGPVAELTQLAELHGSGALTDDEFAEAKRRLIGRMR